MKAKILLARGSFSKNSLDNSPLSTCIHGANLPPTHHIPNILLTQARRGRDLGHFEDMSFSKEAEIAVAAEYSGLCVCVCVHTHVYECVHVCVNQESICE